MIGYVLRKLGIVIPTFIGVTMLTFALIHLIPGDPVLVMLGERGASPEKYAELKASLGLNEPLFVQYFVYISNVLKGDLGKSIITHEPVLSEFLSLFPATIELSFCAFLFATVIGIPAGVLAAVKRGGFWDHSVMTISLSGYSMPIFWWGLLLIILFSVNLGITPVSGRLSALYWIEPITGFMLIDAILSGEQGALASAVHHLVLPSIVLGTIPLAVIARMTRSSMLEVLREDYVRTAKAKGVSSTRVIMVHALRNALIPVVTVIGLQVGVMLAGAILTETIFSWPGIGKWLVDSIRRRDYPSVQGGILIVASVVIFVNLIVDLLYGLINPRIRKQD